ncbi:DUF4381 family protein [Aeromonas molluscorum]|jgi:hypothetical protein|uniref:DUF4381 domain-containing protein n=1 Tax=Aeromonas molluscorum 848 TaxID=1268236 RepID=R1GYP1_9GAMM|nr:DUF4381 family protein [Aeromonas molluscorum]EOD53491.1 hypothetical protein G113_19321 [Aeromonas molluscorum 848]
MTMDAATIVTRQIAEQIRDIHPGPPLDAGWLDPRLGALLLLALLLVLLGAFAWLGHRIWLYWCWRQATGVPPAGDQRLWFVGLHERLRQEGLRRWPISRTLQGADWLAWLDSQGPTDFLRWQHQWDEWLYGGRSPSQSQCLAIHADYLRLGRQLLLGRCYLQGGAG